MNSMTLLLFICYGFRIAFGQNIIKGLVKCENSIVPDIKVKLIESGLLYDSILSDTTTLSDGSFSIDPPTQINDFTITFIRIEYSYDKGSSNSFFVENDFKAIRYEDYKAKYLQIANNLDLSPSHCRAFLLFRQCFIDYENEVEQTHPAAMIHIVTDSYLTAGLPYASTDTIRIPKDSKLDLDIAMHEFAHTVRHSLDGSFLHFMLDVVQYIYAQNHWCDKKTNEGFAFNEGFAELWQIHDDCDKGSVNQNGYDYEGKVVKGLKELADKCHNGKWKKPFVTVLKENPGVIHSFNDFTKFHKLKFDCSL